MVSANPTNNQVSFFVNGMHCASCEVLIEKKILENFPQVKSVNASTTNQKVNLTFTDKKPSLAQLNQLFKSDQYQFTTHKKQPTNYPRLFHFTPKGELQINKVKLKQAAIIIAIASIVITSFVAINRSGAAAYLVVNNTSALPAFFIFGLLASVSSCAALVGGIILSLSKQWTRPGVTPLVRIAPHLFFNLGRLISYTIFGALLGLIGSFFAISLTAAAYLTIVISILMLLLGLQMIDLEKFRQFQITAPKSFTRLITNQSSTNQHYLPFLIGALTFFLPCGFTLTMQGLAITTGSPLHGALLMLTFALGTMPSLLAIGLTSTKFIQRPHTASLFLKTAGVIVIFFALFNLNSQMNVLGFISLSDLNILKTNTTNAAPKGFAPIVNGQQLLTMDALAYGYEPNYFKVQPNIPVRWAITDQGTSGCTNAVISQGLFTDEINLTPNQTTIKEFTPTKPGRYKFSCWMGMVSGIIDVADPDQSAATQDAPNLPTVASGASGCGGGNGSTGCSGGCGGGCGNANCPYKK